jgi:hypothetical protein
MPHSITLSRVEILKRQATRLKKAVNISLSQAQNRLAIENGFQNWSQLSKAAKRQLFQAKPHKIQVYCSILRTPENKEPYFWLEEIPCLHPENHYADAKWIKLKSIHHRNREGINETIATMRRLVHFMDVTGLKTSRAWKSIFRGVQPYGFDHTCVWRDNQKRIIITTEPYCGNQEKISQLSDWCKRNEWQIVQSPKNIGIWNPCSKACNNDCTSHTSLFILAPKKNGGSVKKILSDMRSM